jgi:hypothetical protein
VAFFLACPLRTYARPFDRLRVVPSFVDGSTRLTVDPELAERVEGRLVCGVIVCNR